MRIIAAAIILLATAVTIADTVGVAPADRTDIQGQWTLETTITEQLPNTLDRLFAQLDNDPAFIAQLDDVLLYQLAKEYYPARFDSLRGYIAAERWLVPRPRLVTIDSTLVGPESLVRNALFARRFLEREFPDRSLPDTNTTTTEAVSNPDDDGPGRYTSQAAMKRWYRRCETLADAAERAAALAWWLGGQPYPQLTLERAWVRFLRHGEPTVLGGAGVESAYPPAWDDLLTSQQECAQVLASSMSAIVSGMDTDVQGTALVIYNPLGFDRTEVVTWQGVLGTPSEPTPVARVYAPGGTEVSVQQWSADQGAATSIAFMARVPANGCAVYDLRLEPQTDIVKPATGWNPRTSTLETSRYRLKFAEAGLVSLVDKQHQRELLAAPTRLQLLRDFGATPYAEVPLGGIPETVHAGSHLAQLTFRHEAAGSVFRQRLTVADRRLDWDLDIDWATQGTLLKAAFVATARDSAASYDLAGVVGRDTLQIQGPERPAQRWIDLTDISGEYGLTVMTDAGCGWDQPSPETLRLSLLRTPAGKMDRQDIGQHRLTVSLMGHGPRWRTEAIRESKRMNAPLLVFATDDRHEGPWGRTLSLLRVGSAAGPDNSQVAVRALKKSEDGEWLVVRIQEIAGRAAQSVVVAPLAPARAYQELRADERQITAGDDVDLRGGALVCNLAPGQQRTFALELARPSPQRELTTPRWQPVDLVWNLDGISTADSLTDGDLDGHGRTLPTELVPAICERDGVGFVTGPRQPGAANLLRCDGQILSIPQRDLSQLQLLICSLDGPRLASFTADTGRVVEDWVPDGRAPFGQWDRGDDLAYTTAADVGWIVGHLRDGHGRNLAAERLTFYRIRIDLVSESSPPIQAITLPRDSQLVVLAASVVEPPSRLRGPRELLDRPDRARINIDADGAIFVDSLQVKITSPNRGVSLAVGRDGAVLAPYDGTPLVLRRTTAVAASASGGGLVPTTRLATFRRVEPWPAVVDSLTVAAVRASDDGCFGFERVLDVPATGVFRFWLRGRGLGQLAIDAIKVLDHDGRHVRAPTWHDVPLAAGRHQIRIEFCGETADDDVALEWQGPTIERQEVPVAPFANP